MRTPPRSIGTVFETYVETTCTLDDFHNIVLETLQTIPQAPEEFVALLFAIAHSSDLIALPSSANQAQPSNAEEIQEYFENSQRLAQASGLLSQILFGEGLPGTPPKPWGDLSASDARSTYTDQATFRQKVTSEIYKALEGISKNLPVKYLTNT